MIYKIRHLTTYAYEQHVPFARCALRLTPGQDAAQTLLWSELNLDPRPTRIEEHAGQFGEHVVTATIEAPHDELKILARSRVRVERPLLAPEGGAAWEDVREKALDTTRLDLGSPAQFLYPTPMTALQPPITAFAAESFTPGRPVIEAAFELSARIKRTFAYDPKATEVSTPAIEAFTAKRGVCQDFAHIMISGLKGLGLPAAYVSGYLRTLPPPGKPRLEGADATHAWVNLWCGEGVGWIGFDPTNALIVANDHIVLATGRDYADVAPIGGIVLGPGDQTIKVAVDVLPEDD